MEIPMSKEDVWQIFQCVLSARKLNLSDAQIDWLLQDRVRSDYFDRAVQWKSR